MGFLSRLEKVPSTAEDSAAVETATRFTTEKLVSGEVESGNESPRYGNELHVTPEMERRLLR
jgi:hypothetical protein